MKRILVLFYSQTGQLKEILKKVFSKLASDNHIDYLEIKAPQITFPLNWQSMFDLFPESVLQIPCEIAYDMPDNNQYDAVVLGFQTWFLNLSLPMLAFTQTEDFIKLVENRNVYLLMDCRNSWRNSMNYMERKVISLGGYIKGKYVFGSVGGNFIGSISILHWFFTGNKKMCFFPEPGVPQTVIDQCSEYGKYLFSSKNENQVVKYPINSTHFMPLGIENYALDKFRKWAIYITSDSRYRKRRLVYFRTWLISTIIVISPLVIISKLIAKK